MGYDVHRLTEGRRPVSYTHLGVTVDVYEDEVVHLILDGVQIRADAGPAIYIAGAEKAVITAKEGTYSVLSDSAHRREGADACIFSEADLTLNGSGRLAIFGFHEHGIRSRDVVKAVGSPVYVKAKGDGIRGNNGVIPVSYTHLDVYKRQGDSAPFLSQKIWDCRAGLDCLK